MAGLCEYVYHRGTFTCFCCLLPIHGVETSYSLTSTTVLLKCNAISTNIVSSTNTDHPPPHFSSAQLHEIIDAAETDRSVFQSNFAFRLMLNGEVMTSSIEGCQDDNELCDMQILSELISGFATRDRNCQPTKSILSVLLGSDKGLSGPVKCFLMILLGAALGGAGVFYYLTGSIPRPSCQNRNRSGFESRESGMSIPPTSYSDEPESYQDGPDKNPTNYLS